jgi:uncharacterized protein
MPARKTAKTNGSRNGAHKANGKANGHPFRVGRSRTGLGLFATEDIKKGTYIAEYLGPLMTNAECDKTPENKYWFEINSRWTINGATRKNIARYFNHSCRPNADPMIRDKRVRIKTIKNIKAGDEITYDYGKDYCDAYIKPHGCKCDKCLEKRARERADARAASARRKKRAARKASQAAAAR